LERKGGKREKERERKREKNPRDSLFFREIHQYIFYRVTFSTNKRESLYF
jgi:hypothetical protein